MIWFFAITMMLCSCDKDGDLLYMSGFGSSDLIATTDNVVLSIANSKQVVLSLAWQNPALLSSDSTKTVADGVLKTYLQVSPTSDFSGTVNESTVTNLSKAYNGADLNNLAKGLGLNSGVSTPVYFRIKSTEGNNMDPAYSNVCEVDITPFTIYMNSLSVLNSAKTDTLGTIYSDTENGIYTGYMAATSWLNCWFAENDGTVWGNYPTSGHAFELSNASDAWNCWFGDGTGIWYVNVDTKNSEWSGALLSAVTINGTTAKYDSNVSGYSVSITTTADNTTIGGSAEENEYTAATGDGSYNSKTLTLPDTTIAKAGTYTVNLVVGSHAQLEYQIVSSSETPDEPSTSIPSALYMYTKDGATLLATMTETSSGIYTCSYTPTAAWENFRFKDTENNILYGSDSSDLFTLSSADGSWDIWFKDDFTIGAELTVTANLNTMKWEYKTK